ncbi:MAG: hypothetical protein KC729_18865, partial [Candidatus Eisenbacteria bacterium]|nr:hypothetical protein [Candidatus Eisenbacteria bacterium]
MRFARPMHLFLMATLFFGVLMSGCGKESRIMNGSPVGGTVPDGPIEPTVLPDSVVFSTWVLDEGHMLSSVVAGVEVTALDLQEDGHARVWFHDNVTGANDCAR